LSIEFTSFVFLIAPPWGLLKNQKQSFSSGKITSLSI
jgi:hypothetical protein